MFIEEKRLRWQEAPKAKRVHVCKFYVKYIRRTEGIITTVEKLDFAWRGCWFDVIEYTFGPDAWNLK